MVNFTFVPHKGARPEKSELVKSHVMRESQRRRREARQQRHQTLTAAGQQPSAIATASQSRDPAGPGIQSQLPLRPSPILISGPQNTVRSSENLPLLWPAGNFAVAPDGGNSPTSDFPSGPYFSLDFLNLYSAFGPGQNSSGYSEGFEFARYDPSNVLTQQPRVLYPVFQSENEPSNPEWMSESLFDRVNELTAHYTATLYIERPGLPAINPVVYWQRRALVNSKILLSTALFYCAYRDTVRGIASDDHHYYKDRILHLINLALGNPATAVSDDNIAAVISMCMYENIRGSNLIVTHLRGLRQMLDMRGGVNNFHSDQGQFIGEMAIIQDLMHASCSNVPPMMFDIQAPNLRDLDPTNIQNWYPQSPLRIINDGVFVQPIMELQASFGTLKDAFEAFEILCIEAFDPETARAEAARFKLRREKFLTRLRHRDSGANDEIPPTANGKAEEAIHLAAKIHLRAVAFRMQHDDEANVSDMKRLHAVIRRIDLGFWKTAHYVYLWILLTGGAASSKHADYRPHFVSEILRLGLSIGLFDWRSFRQTLGNFLWLQQFLRRNGSRPSAAASEEDTGGHDRK